MQKRVTFIPPPIVYNIKSVDSADYRVTYKFTAHALREKAGFNSLFVNSDSDDSDASFFFNAALPGKPEAPLPGWCLQRAIEAPDAYLSSSTSKPAGWTAQPLDTTKKPFYTGTF